MYYFDYLPKELNIIILSYYQIPHKVKFTINHYIQLLDILHIDDDNSILNVLKLAYSKEYSIILDMIKNHKFSPIQSLYELQLKFSNSYFIKMYNGRVNFKNMYPGLYERVKNFNLNGSGTQNIKNNTVTKNMLSKNAWRDFLNRLLKIKNEDFFTDTMYRFRDTGIIPDNYIYDSDETIIAYHDYIIYLIYALVLSDNYKFEIQSPENNFYVLLSAYWYNTEIYNQIRERMSDKVYKEMMANTTVERELELMEDSNEDGEEGRSEDEPLRDYIYERANMM